MTRRETDLVTRPEGGLLYGDPQDALQFGYSVQGDLTLEDIQQILELPSTVVQGPEQVAERRMRSDSSCSQETGSPESGISGCHSPRENMMGSSPMDPVHASMAQAKILPGQLASQGFLDNIDMNGLLALAEESNQLMINSNTELESFTSSLHPSTSNQAEVPRSNSTVLYRPVPGEHDYSSLPTRQNIIVRSYEPSPLSNQPLSPPSPYLHPQSSVIVRASPGTISPSHTISGTISFSPEPEESVMVPATVSELRVEEPVLTRGHHKPETDWNTASSVVGVDVLSSPSPSSRSVSTLYVCYVCGEPAGKHSYYGGQVCASCRAFFRRSVQSKYYEIFECKKEKNCLINAQTRKNCQFCRFKKCLESGMKTSWVLSDEERNRRFNKFNKVKSVNNDKAQTMKSISPARLPELYMAFTLEEQKSLEDVQRQFRGQWNSSSWLKNLFLLNRDAGINLIEAAYKVTPIKYETWSWMLQSWSLLFSQNVLPYLTRGYNIPSREFSQLLHGSNTYVAHTFKSSICIEVDVKKEPVECSDDKSRPCHMSKQVIDLADSGDRDISQMLEKLNVKETVPQMPSYKDLYPSQWANDKDTEEKHLQLLTKIQSWPRNDKNEVDCNMVMMVMLIIFFDTHSNPLINTKAVEEIQLKYSLLLQRYLRSKMAAQMANKKFLEAMLILSYSRELWEMNQLHARN